MGHAQVCTTKKCTITSLVIGLVGISVFSSATFAAEYDAYPTIIRPQIQQTMTTQSQNSDDLELYKDVVQDLGGKLGSVWQEVKVFLKNGIEKLPQTQKSVTNTATYQPNQQQAVMEQQGEEISFFDDILQDVNKYHINTLASYTIIKGHQRNFLPQNHVFLSDLSKVLVNTYRIKVGYTIDSDIGLIQKDFTTTENQYINTAYIMGMFDNIFAYNQDNIAYNTSKEVTFNELNVILQNIETQYPGLINKAILTTIPSSDNAITRSEMSKYLVESFGLTPKVDYQDNIIKKYFSDTQYHPYGEAAETLADLEIVYNKAQQFYIDNYTTRAEFITMMSKTLLHSNDSSIDTQDLKQPNIGDLDETSVYYTFITYAYNKGLLDYLLETKREENYLSPSALITKHEAYHLLSLVTNVQIQYNNEIADKEFITRGEVGQLLVDLFELNQSSTNLAKQPREGNPFKQLTNQISLLSKAKELF